MSLWRVIFYLTNSCSELGPEKRSEHRWGEMSRNSGLRNACAVLGAARSKLAGWKATAQGWTGTLSVLLRSLDQKTGLGWKEVSKSAGKRLPASEKPGRSDAGSCCLGRRAWAGPVGRA